MWGRDCVAKSSFSPPIAKSPDSTFAHYDAIAIKMIVFAAYAFIDYYWQVAGANLAKCVASSEVH